MKSINASVSAAIVATVFAAGPTEAGAQQVRLELADGRVTLEATDALPSAILAEWARLGGTRIVDGDRVPGTPLTLRLEGVPEREALDIILRSAAGYVAATRSLGSVGASRFDRIVVMPVSANAATARSGPAPAAAAPVMMATEPTPDASMNPADVVQQDVTAQVDDGTGAEQPVSSTDFDYANPQRYFAARAAQQRAAEAAAQGEATGASVDDERIGVSSPGGFSTGAVLSSPGTIPVPDTQRPAAGAPSNQPPVNPYGLPPEAAPGSSSAPPMEPDRSKYINPYGPTPQSPPGP